MSAYLRVHDLSVRFRRHVGTHESQSAPDRIGGALAHHGRHHYVNALDHVEFELEEGDRLAIVGHNGSGKSTLLRALAGIYPPHSGHVDRSGSVASLFNISLGFRQEASGYRNIIIKGLMEGRSRDEIERTLPAIVEFSGLGPYIDMPLHTYSQGMAMRLAFSIATSFPNDILLIDEWIGAGDAAFRERMVSRMNSYLDAARIVVIASHSAGLLKRVATKALWLESGAVRCIGSVDEVIDRYDAAASSADGGNRTQVGANLIIDLTTGGIRLHWEIDGATDNVYVKLLLIKEDGSHRVVGSGGPSGGTEPLPWLRAGHELRLVDALMGVVLARKVVTAADVSSVTL